MFEALVIVTREGVEAALVVAIVLAYLRKTGRERWTRWVLGGVAVAVVLSALGAWILPGLIARELVLEEAVEGWLLMAGGVCVATLVYWLVRSGKHMKREIDEGLSRLSDGAGSFGWGVTLFVTLLLLREGLETVLFLTAISFNTEGLQRLFGALTGLALALVFGVLVVRGAVRVDLRKFFAATTAILCVLAVQLFVGAYHEFAEVGWLPANRQSMAIVGPIVRYDSLLFATAILIAFFFLRGKPTRQGEVSARAATTPSAAGATSTSPSSPVPANPAERRLAESTLRRDRRIGRAGSIAALAVVAVLLTGFLSQARVPPRVDGEPVTPTGGSLRISTAGWDEREVRFYQVSIDGHTVRFFVAGRPQGDRVACLDACIICGDIGYYTDAVGLTCRNCTAPINPASLGIGGGCNPIPLAATAEGDGLIIPESALRESARYFPVTR